MDRGAWRVYRNGYRICAHGDHAENLGNQYRWHAHYYELDESHRHFRIDHAGCCVRKCDYPPDHRQIARPGNLAVIRRVITLANTTPSMVNSKMTMRFVQFVIMGMPPVLISQIFCVIAVSAYPVPIPINPPSAAIHVIQDLRSLCANSCSSWGSEESTTMSRSLTPADCKCSKARSADTGVG